MGTENDPAKARPLKAPDCRQALLDTVCFAAERLWRMPRWQESLPEIVEQLGRAADASRVCIYRIESAGDTGVLARRLCSWTDSPEAGKHGPADSGNLSMDAAVPSRWLDAMARGEPIHRLASHFSEDERAFLVGQGVESIVSVPIHVDEEWWGGISFEHCSEERSWSIAEVDVMARAAGIVGAAVTRSRSDERLRESEQRYRDLVDLLPQPVFEVDVDGNLLFANHSAFDSFGYTKEDFRDGLNAFNMFNPDDLDRLGETMQKRLDGRIRESIEYRARRKDGSTFPVLAQAAPIYRDGVLAGLRGVLIDITERNRTEQMLRNSEQLYRMIFNHSPLGIMQFDENGVIVDCNERFLQIIGSTRETVIGFRMLESLHNEELKTAVQAALAGTTGYYEGEYSSVTGNKTTFLGTIFCRVTSERGDFLCGLCIAEDISERKRAEHALRQSEARYRAIVEDQTELVSRFSPDGTLTFVNEAYCRYFGETAEELIGNKFWHHLPLEDQQKFRKYLAKMNAQNQVMTMDYRVYTSTGEIRWQQWTDRAICDDEGRIVEFQAVGRDVTERRRTEDALQESEKQLRFLSSQILKAQETERQRIARDLHDSIIQSLATMKINLRVNLRHLLRGEFDKTRDSFEAIISMIGDAIEEVRRVYTDLRPSMLDNLGIIATIGWACQEFQEAHEKIHVQSRTEAREEEIPEGLKIVIYRIIQEALNNIAKHSRASLVTVSLIRQDDRIHLSVEDNGCGFNAAHMLSDKRRAHGLGLVSMKERTELSGGTFSVESAEQCGTTIRSSWPCDQSEHG